MANKPNNMSGEFYRILIAYHNSAKLKGLFRMLNPDGVTLQKVDGDYGLAGALDVKGRELEPVERYDLVYGVDGKGFQVFAHWHGTHFAHTTTYKTRVEGGVLLCVIPDKQGKWPVLDAFPDLTLHTLEMLSRESKKLETMYQAQKAGIEATLT